MNRPARFLLKTALFLVPLILLAALVEMRLAKVPNSYNIKRNNFEQQLNDINILVLGSSQSVFGIDPDSFSIKGFNLADQSQDYFYDRALVLKYLDKMPNLKQVIIPVVYCSMYFQLKDVQREFWRCFFYHNFWGIDNPALPVMDSRRYSNYMLYNSFTAISYLAGTDSTGVSGKMKRNGYWFNSVKSGVSDESGKKWVVFHDSIIATGNNAEVANQIEDLTSKLRSRNIKVVFVYEPVCQTYSKYCDPKIIASTNEYFRHLCSKFDCTYLNYFTDPRFTMSDFADDDHLNPKGAAKFSGILNTEAIKPALSGK